MEFHDWISSIISGGALIVSLLGYLKGREALRITDEREINRRWTLDISTDRGPLMGQITYGRDGPPIRIMGLKIIEPKGAMLQRIDTRIEKDPNEPTRILSGNFPHQEGPRPTIEFDTEMNMMRGALGGMINIYVVMPRRPIASAGTTELRLAVCYEDIDAKRERHHVPVKAHDVPWSR